MIRFRIGQSWKRERTPSPVDAFGLDLDGVELLRGANEEALAKVVPELVDALHALAVEEQPSAQLSLPEAHLELVLHRRGGEVMLRVVSLARPARVVRPPVGVELAELTQAAIRCGRALAKDLADAAPKLLAAPRSRRMLKRLSALDRAPWVDGAGSAEESGFGYRLGARPLGFGFELEDPEDLLLAFRPQSAFGLPSLLCAGALTFRWSEAHPEWRAAGAPFLMALELSRQAGELVQAIEAGEEHFTFEPAGARPPVTVRLRLDELELDGKRAPAPALQLARSMYDLGLAVAFAATTRNKAQLKNPYVTELIERCREGLSHLRGLVASADPARAARGPRKKAASQPLRAGGRLRRLRFDRLWEKSSLASEQPGKLLVNARGGPIFASLQMACGFSEQGDLLFRRVATHGVATSADGRVVTASGSRVEAYAGAEASARWLKDHDGVSIGPDLYRKDGRLIALSEWSGAIAYCELTGREVWRIAPPRTRRGHLSLQGHRVLFATDSGYLYGLDLIDGRIRYRMRAALPFACSPLPWGKKLVALLSRAEHAALIAADAHSGAIAWTRELPLANPSRPLAIGSRVYVAGEHAGEPVLVSLSAKGAPVWQRPLHLGRGPLALLAVGRSVAAVDAAGAAALVGGDGQVEWRLGAVGEELAEAIAPSLVRGVLIIPGDSVRAVDPRGGRVLADVRAGAGLCDLKVDGKLNLYLLDEAGTLRAYRLTSHFAVV